MRRGADDRIRRTDARRRGAAVSRQRSARTADSARALRGSRASLRSARRPLAVQRSHDAAGGCAARGAARRRRRACRSRSGCATGNRTSPTRCARSPTRGARRVLGFIMAAHRSEASFERYQATVDDARAAIGEAAPEVVYPEPWHDHPLFIDGGGVARARGVRATRSAGAIARAADLHRAQYSARDGECGAVRRSAYAVGADGRGGAWRSTRGNSRIRAAAAVRATRGSSPTSRKRCGTSTRRRRWSCRSVFCAITSRCCTISISKRRKSRASAGIRMERAPTVGDHPLFIEMMASIVAAHAR